MARVNCSVTQNTAFIPWALNAVALVFLISPPVSFGSPQGLEHEKVVWSEAKGRQTDLGIKRLWRGPSSSCYKLEITDDNLPRVLVNGILQELQKSIATPVYQRLATHGTQLQPPQQQQPIPPPAPPIPPQQSEDERWETIPTPTDSPHLPNPQPPQPVINAPVRTSSLSSTMPGMPPPTGTPLPPRSSSPMSAVTNISSSNKLVRHHDRERDPHYQQQRKKTQTSAPVAMSILRALEPPTHQVQTMSRPQSEDRERYPISENGHSNHSHRDIREASEKKEKRGFWSGRDKDREKEKEKEREQHHNRDSQKDRARDLRRDDDGQGDLTRMIGLSLTQIHWICFLTISFRLSHCNGLGRLGSSVRSLRPGFSK